MKKFLLILLFTYSFQSLFAQQTTFIREYSSFNAKYIESTFDRGYIMSGQAGTSGYDFGVVKTDSMGAIQWAKSYGGIYIDICDEVVQNADSGYAFFGRALNHTGSGDSGDA